MGSGRVAAWFGVTLALPAAVLACRQLVGIGDDTPRGPPSTPSDAGAEGGFVYGQGACADCVAESCAPQAAACADDPVCRKLEGCLAGCTGDPTCRAQCGVDDGLGYPGSTPAFEACLARSCTGECALTCGGLDAVFPPATAPACEQCISSGSECASVTRCAQDPECQTAVRCQFSSRTLDVQQACPTIATDGGANTFLYGQNSPIASTCSGDCAWGADWSCLGKVDWPTARGGPVAMTMRVYTYSNGAPVDGATVSLCNTTEPPCTPPLDTGTTGDAGTVPLTLPQEPTSAHFFAGVTSPTLTPALSFLVFPLSTPQMTVPLPVIPAGELPALGLYAGVPLDPTLGLVIISAVDCRLAPAPGVTFGIEPQGTSTLAYVQQGLPVLGATSTDFEGVAVFANVEANTNLTITMTSPAGPAGSVEVFARPAGMSYVYAPPTK